MLINGEKLGAFIVPTGIGASIGGFAGDASLYARNFAKKSKLIVNPNVVNAGVFSGITDNMLYVEGYSLDEFFKGNLKLVQTRKNNIGVIFDKAIPKDVLNIHLNTINAVKCVYGVDIKDYVITDEKVGIDFTIEESGASSGGIKNPETILRAAKLLISRGCNAIAIVCLFEDPEELNKSYCNGSGTDPVGGVEAIISHYISKELCIPCAHSPAFEDYQIYPNLVDIRSASEYITPTFLPCILLGLNIAPQFSKSMGIGIEELDYLVMPYNSLGSTPVFEALKHNINVFAIKENITALKISPEKISNEITVFGTYEELLLNI